MASDEAVRLPGLLPAGSAEPAYRFLSPHQAAVIDAATRRLAPGPEVDAVTYLDHLLSVFAVAPTDLHAGGSLWQRVADLRDQYTSGIAMLDHLAGGDFTAIPRLCQDLILSRRQVAPFAGLLFELIAETIYAVPECDRPIRFR